MQDKRIKLIYFSMGGSEVRQISLGWKKIVGLSLVTFVLLLSCVVFILHTFTDFFHNWEIVRQKKSNTQLRQMLSDMGQQIEQIETKVKSLEKEDDDLRVFVDLPAIDSDTRNLGIGGTSLDTYANFTTIDNDDDLNKAIKIKRMVENMEQRVSMATESRNEIMKKYNEDLQRLKHTPSIRPVTIGRISADFGLRLDPFVEQYRQHDGIDITAPRGTDVHVSADGRVIEAIPHYVPNKGLGKYIIVDHGFGYKTVYGHLSRILVKPGQKVKRYDIIAKVGDTGRSTGPHLHYEVRVNNKKTDPKKYIIE